MGEQERDAGTRSPRVAMLVNNGVAGDSRVQKVAWSMAARGYDVTLVGLADEGVTERQELRLGHARVVLAPRERVLSVGVRRAGGPSYREAVTTLRRWDATELAARPGASPSRRLLLRLSLWWSSLVGRSPALDAASERLRRSPAGRALLLVAGLLDRDGGWRQLNPYVQDLELSLGPVLDDLGPDLVHAHDFHTVGIAARAVARARGRGRRTRWVYDAHEYVAGTSGGTGLRLRLRHRFFVGQEREYAPLADAVVTVSDPIADLLHRDLRLAGRPTVVANVPPVGGGHDVPSLREAAGVAAGEPLVVYSGSCAPQRGVSTVVEALDRLPGVVLVLVAAEADRYVAELRRLAESRGVADRLRVAPFVAPDAVPAYLREADAGVSPLRHRPNHELSLNTKYAEYVHAGLPVVTSDVRTMAAFTREHGIGEVFTAEDPASCADALRRVLDDPQAYRARYTDGALARSLSWQRQEELLADLYERLSGVGPRPRADHGPLRLQASGPRSR